MRKVTTRLVITIGLLILLNPLSASTLHFSVPAEELGLRQEIEIEVKFNSREDVVNALEGVINTPRTLEITSIRDGSSLISFWIERPEINNNGDIIFSGIIPGGWSGEDGLLFSFMAVTTAEGRGHLSAGEFNVFLHDGFGTKVDGDAEQRTLLVDADVPVTDYVGEMDDKTSPEVFTLELATSTYIFNGDYFLVFSTQDKKLGIDRYEVFEGRSRVWNTDKIEWVLAKSPYRLNDQSLKSYIYVRAVDRAGNEQIAVYTPERPFLRLSNVIIILILLLVILFFHRLRRRGKG